MLQRNRREHLPRILFLQEIRHDIYQGNVQKSSRSEREDPGYCFSCTNMKALVITETEPQEIIQKGKKIHKDDKHCLPLNFYRDPREPYLLLLVTEHILQSRLLEFPPELWKAASWLHSSGQSQPEVGLQSLQPKKTKS